MTGPETGPPTAFEAVVIGTGFGGSVSACRLAKRWPGSVMVLERGRRYPPGSFPRTPGAMAENTWNVDGEHSGVPRYVKRDQRGLFDIRAFRRLDAVVAAGYGGGSLIYANVIMQPPREVFEQDRWPTSCRHATLQPYYSVVREVLHARPVPITGPGREVRRATVFREAAVKMGRTSAPVDVAVFFGNDPDVPLDRGDRATNRYGVEQASCTYCAECNIGCNDGAKNSLDMNYLYVAEHVHGAHVRTDCTAEQIVPLGSDGRPDVHADGSHGYEVTFRDLANDRSERVTARRVVVSAGALGSTELLLRCRDVHRTLPRLSRHLGRSFSGNGDFLSFVTGIEGGSDPLFGPVITQHIDFHLFDGHHPSRGFVLEDAGYPNQLAWMIEGAKPGVMKLTSVARTARHLVGRYVTGRSGGRIGYTVRDLMAGDISSRAAVLLCMGVDNANGVLSLNSRGWLQADWPRRENRDLYRAIVSAGREFKRATGASGFATAPNWWLPFRRNITVHALGGCVLADDPGRGVVHASRDRFGEVHHYRNLSVADGAIVPAAVGSNPAATIAALSEMVAERVTGIAPTADL